MVVGNRPPGSERPVTTSATAAAISSPPNELCRTAATSSAHVMSTGPAALTTTTVRAFAAATFSNELGLAPGQLEEGTIVALGLPLLARSHHDDRYIGACGRRHRPLHQCVGVERAETHPETPGGTLARVELHHELNRPALGRRALGREQVLAGHAEEVGAAGRWRVRDAVEDQLPVGEDAGPAGLGQCQLEHAVLLGHDGPLDPHRPRAVGVLLSPAAEHEDPELVQVLLGEHLAGPPGADVHGPRETVGCVQHRTAHDGWRAVRLAARVRGRRRLRRRVRSATRPAGRPPCAV